MDRNGGGARGVNGTREKADEEKEREKDEKTRRLWQKANSKTLRYDAPMHHLQSVSQHGINQA